MIESIKKAMESSVQLSWLHEAGNEWDTIVNESECALVKYNRMFVEYQNCYFADRDENYNDLSFLLYSGGRPAAILPLCVFFREGRWVIGSEGVEIFAPLLARWVKKEESKRKLFRKLFSMFNNIKKVVRQERMLFIAEQLEGGIGVWERMILEEGGTIVSVNIECYLNLIPNSNDILKQMRRTNRYCITKGANLWTSRIVTKDNDEDSIDDCIERFRKFHIDVAGRETRSYKSWLAQGDGIKRGEDFVVELYDKDDKLIGASLYQANRTVAMYSVGVYDRSLFDKPVTHICQWVAIQHMKQMGLKWYYIGKRYYMNDAKNPSDKEISISHFKEGFATDFYSSYILTL